MVSSVEVLVQVIQDSAETASALSASRTVKVRVPQASLVEADTPGSAAVKVESL